MAEMRMSASEIRQRVDMELHHAGLFDSFGIKDVFATGLDEEGNQQWDFAIEAKGEIPGAADITTFMLILNDAKEKYHFVEHWQATEDGVSTHRTLH